MIILFIFYIVFVLNYFPFTRPICSIYVYKTRMTTFIKTKFKISDDQTNIDKYRLAANITEYHIISKLIFLRIIIPNFMMIRQLFHVKMCKMNVRTIGSMNMSPVLRLIK